VVLGGLRAALKARQFTPEPVNLGETGRFGYC
jgi:hypothetical protein